MPSDIIAAFLWAQICKAEEITSLRMNAWNKYHELLSEFESKGMLTRPHVPSECAHNAHMYYVLLDEGKNRDDIIRKLDSVGINAIFHYVPLHSAPQGLRSGRISGSMSNTDDVSRKILRLPMWVGVDAERVVEGLKKVL